MISDMLIEELSLVETTCINQMESIKKNQLYFTVDAYKASCVPLF